MTPLIPFQCVCVCVTFPGDTGSEDEWTTAGKTDGPMILVTESSEAAVPSGMWFACWGMLLGLA